MSHAIPAKAPRVSLRRLRRWVHRAIVAEVVTEVHEAPSVPASEGWLCGRCWMIVAPGQDRSPHYVPGHEFR